MKLRHLAIAAVVLAGGGVPVVAATTGTASASTTSAQHRTIHKLPRWFAWTWATKATTREVCGPHQPRAIIVWAKGLDDDQSVPVCANGTIGEPS